MALEGPEMAYRNDLIIDVGMHQGMDTDFYLRKGFRVVAVEANQALVEAARNRFADAIREGRLTIYPIGIYDRSGEFDFYVNEDKDDWSSIFEHIGGRHNTKHHVEKVQCVTFDTILRETGIPYYLKIDIEHADLLALRELHKFQDRPKYVSCEAIEIDIFFEMKRLGYRRFKLVNQQRNSQVKCPEPPLEGMYVDAQFSGFHSGPFGEEAPGEWTSMEEVIYDFLHHHLGLVLSNRRPLHCHNAGQ